MSPLLRTLAGLPLASMLLVAGGGASKPADGGAGMPASGQAKSSSGKTKQACSKAKTTGDPGQEFKAVMPTDEGRSAAYGRWATAVPARGQARVAPHPGSPEPDRAGACTEARLLSAGAGAARTGAATLPAGAGAGRSTAQSPCAFATQVAELQGEEPAYLDLGASDLGEGPGDGRPGSRPIRYENESGVDVRLVLVAAPGDPVARVRIMDPGHPGRYPLFPPAGLPLAAGGVTYLYPDPRAAGTICEVLDGTGSLLKMFGLELEPAAPPSTPRGAGQ